MKIGQWDIVYKSAVQHDGSLLFPERLTQEFLDAARRTMGSYLYTNQYLNKVIPEDEQTFRPEWLRQWKILPSHKLSFGFIDPAIGQKNHNDYTGIAIVDTDTAGNWYLRLAARMRLTPTQIVSKMFELCETFQLRALGVEVVAYQEALLYILDEEMKRRQKVIPVKGVQRRAISKETRILGLVPRFEWGRIFVPPGCTDFEDEVLSFPRASHDDILDACASLEEFVTYPQPEVKKIEKPHSPADRNYERWVIEQYANGKDPKSEFSGTEGIG